VGDGSTKVNDLPFIDAGTINGLENFLIKVKNYNALPNIGSDKLLYLDLSTSNIYYWDSQKGYVKAF